MRSEVQKILCVDDEPFNVGLLEALLTPKGYEVISAKDGYEALSKIHEFKPDLVLLDIMMPGMSGYEVLGKIRENKDTRLIPVVMLTALSEVEDRVKAMEAGCDDFISKPFDKTELYTRVNSLLRISFYRNQLDEKEKFRSVVNVITDGVIVCDNFWKIYEINEAAKKYLNLPEEKNIDFLTFVYNSFSVSTPIEEIKPLNYENLMFDIIRPAYGKNKPLILEASIDAIKNPDGLVSSIVITLRDVSLTRSDNIMKQTFVSSISYKFRDPMSIILYSLDLIKDPESGDLNEKQKEYIDNISKEANRINKFYEDLIMFSMYSSKIYMKISKPASLFDFVNRFAGEISGKYPEEKIIFDNQIKTDIPLLMFDMDKMEIVFNNLLENSVVFNDNQEKKIKVEAVKKDKDFVEISFSDNGYGIPSEEFENIFKPFYQIENSQGDVGNVEGNGLGLALVKKIIDSAGGNIKVESKPQEGTTISFTVPVAK